MEYVTLEWVDWFNNRRLGEPIGNIPPAAEAEANFYAALKDQTWPRNEYKSVSDKPGAVQFLLHV